MDDLFQTLDRMGIKPGGGTISGSLYTEHRVVRVKVSKSITDDHEFQTRSELTSQLEKVEDEDMTLAAGDRVVIRYLDEPSARQEFYVLSERASDPMNGLLSISSPLAKALAEASPGDEIVIRIGDRDRTVLYMNLERQPRQAA